MSLGKLIAVTVSEATDSSGNKDNPIFLIPSRVNLAIFEWCSKIEPIPVSIIFSKAKSIANITDNAGVKGGWPIL